MSTNKITVLDISTMTANLRVFRLVRFDAYSSYQQVQTDPTKQEQSCRQIYNFIFFSNKGERI